METQLREIVRSEFLVCPGGLCVPTEGALRIEEVRGIPYLIGHSTWQRCGDWAEAREQLAARIEALDPHALASDAIFEGDPLGAGDLA